jgi:O-antigen ligase
VPNGRTPSLESRTSTWAFRALLAFVAINVLSPQSFVPALEPLRLAFLSAMAAAATYLADRWSAAEGVTRPTPRESILIWSLVCWAMITLPMSIWPGGSVSALLDYLKTVIIFWLLGNVITRTDRLRTLFWTLSFCTLPLALTALKDFASGVTSADGSRIPGYTSGLASNPNDLALTLNIVMPLTAALVLTARGRATRWIGLGIIGIGTLGIVVTFSRGGFVTLATIIVLSVVNLMRRGHWGVIGGGALALLLAIPALPEGYLDRLSTISSVESDTTGSSQERWEVMTIALAAIEQRPITGSGIGMDALAVQNVRGGHYIRVHNAYLDFAVDLGVAGLVLFVAALVTTIRTAWRVEAQPADGSAADRDLPTLAQGVRISLIGFAVAANFAPVPYDVYFYYLAGLAVAAWHCRTSQTAALAVSAATPRL